jgi:hypothetical protein
MSKSNVPPIVANPIVVGRAQGKANRGWQDKSADVCRAHMVGWMEVLRCSQQFCAGASATKFNSFNAASAIAGKITDRRLL